MALRPELTPSLARLVLQKGKQLPLPAKWYQVGSRLAQVWRCLAVVRVTTVDSSADRSVLAVRAGDPRQEARSLVRARVLQLRLSRWPLTHLLCE